MSAEVMTPRKGESVKLVREGFWRTVTDSAQRHVEKGTNRRKDKGQHSLKMHLAPVGVSGKAMAPRRTPDLTGHAQLAKQSTTQHL